MLLSVTELRDLLLAGFHYGKEQVVCVFVLDINTPPQCLQPGTKP